MCVVADLIHKLKAKKLTIGSCESLTAGLFTSTLASVPGASSVLKGGFTTYMSEAKTDVVGVDKQVIALFGVISEETAMQMASKAGKLLNCDICVSFSGNAGPDVMEEKPVGMVCCGVWYQGKSMAFTLQLAGDRNEIRNQAVVNMCQYIIQLIK